MVLGTKLTPSGGTGITTAVRNAPFFQFLTDDGTDYGVAENYGSATDLYWQTPGNAEIYDICITFGDNSLFQSANPTDSILSSETTFTNGLKFCIKNTGGTVVQNLSITQPLLCTTQIMCFGTSTFMWMEKTSATNGNNGAVLQINVDCMKKYGGPLFLPLGFRFVCTVQDNFTNLNGQGAFQLSVSGHYV